MGEDFRSRHGRALLIGCCVYLGNGIDGIYPFVRTIVMACERDSSRPLTLGVYAVAEFCGEDGHGQLDNILVVGASVVLAV